MNPEELLSAPSPEVIPPFETIAALETFLDNENIRRHILTHCAQYAGENAQRYLSTAAERIDHTVRPPKVYDLDPDIFKVVFDPELPTIVIDTMGAFTGHELVGVAAQQRRMADRPSCNVVLMPSGTDCGRIVTLEDGTSKLEVTHGIIMSDTGDVFTGELPKPIRADLVETTNDRLRTQCEQAGVTLLNGVEMTDQCNTKTDLSEQLRGTSVRMPQRFDLDQIWAEDPDAAYVIKPSTGSQGRGVRMFNNATQKQDAVTYFQFLQKHGYQPIIEERVYSYPLHIPPTAVTKHVFHQLGGALVAEPSPSPRQDWNVRVIIASGRVIDMYVRMDDWDKNQAVNRSMGARAVSMSGMPPYAADPTEATRLFEALLHASTDLARRFPAGMAGADLTINESMEAVLYEINIGHTGGLQTIALLHDNPELKLAASNSLIETWLSEYDLTRPPSEPYPALIRNALRTMGLAPFRLPELNTVAEQPMQRSLSQLITTLDVAAGRHLLATMPEHEIMQLNPAHVELAMLLEAGYLHAYGLLGAYQRERLRYLDEMYSRVAPLEFAARIGDLAQLHEKPTYLLQYIRQFEPLLPDGPNWELAKLAIQSTSSMPNVVLATLERLVASGQAPLSCSTLAAGGLMLQIYTHFGLRYTDIDSLQNSPVGLLYAQFLGDGYSAVRPELLHLPQTHPTIHRPLLALAGLQLAIAYGDTPLQNTLIDVLMETEDDLVISGMLHELLPYVGTDLAQLDGIIHTAVYSDILLTAVSTYVSYAPRLDAAARDHLAGTLATEIALSLGESTEAAAAFKTFVLALLDDPSEAQLPPRGSLRTIAHALLTGVTHNYEDVEDLVAMIDADPYLSTPDKAGLEALLEDGLDMLRAPDAA